MNDTATRIQTPYLVAEDELDRSLRPRRLEEFIGQDALRRELSVAIEACSARGEALDHLLLAGPPANFRQTASRILRSSLSRPSSSTSSSASAARAAAKLTTPSIRTSA